MKKNILKILLYFIVILLFIFLNKNILGQTATPSSTLTPSEKSNENEAIKNLKEKIANKVEEIRKKNNKAVAGKVIELLNENSLKIKTWESEDFEVKLQESGLTKYYKITGNQQKEIEKEDIKKNDYIFAEGVINDKTIIANSVFVDQEYLVGNGKISTIDSTNYIIKVITSDKTVFNLSIETYTKQQMINIKSLKIEKIGFSKIKEGDTIHFVVKATNNEKNNEYSAEKILIIPQEYFLK